MLRRRYVALVGASLLAGCGTDDGGTPTAASTPTDTGTDSGLETTVEPSTGTDGPGATETEPSTGEERAAAALEDAAASIQQAHDAYVSYASDDATRLPDVGPETASFNGDRIQTICEQARERVDAARADAATHQQPRIQRLQGAITWLSGAAGMQESLGTVATFLRQADQTASGGARLDTVASHLRSARSTTEDLGTAYENLDPPRTNAFQEIDGVDGDDVEAKHRQLGRETSGLEDLAGLVDETVGGADGEDGESDGENGGGGAVGSLQSARSAYDAGRYERAGNLAESAEAALQNDVLGLVDTVDPDSLQPLLDSFVGAVEALRDRAASLAEDAAGQ